MRARRLLTAFLAARSGVAAVEFALIVPLMLLLFIGAVETSQGIAADRKLDALTTTLGDLVARHSGDIEQSTIEDYFSIAIPLMLPYDADEVSQRLTIVSVDSGGDGDVTDSVAHNGATPLASGANFDLPAEIAALAQDNAVVVAEAWYDYSPVLGYAIGDISMAKRQYYIPRALGGIDIVTASSGGSGSTGGGSSGGSGSGGGGSGGGNGGSGGGGGNGGGNGGPSGGGGGVPLLCRILPFLCR